MRFVLILLFAFAVISVLFAKPNINSATGGLDVSVADGMIDIVVTVNYSANDEDHIDRVITVIHPVGDIIIEVDEDNADMDLSDTDIVE